MATPTVGTVGGYNTAATLASTTLTAIQANTVVTRLTLSETISESALRIGDNSPVGALFHGKSLDLNVELIYKTTDFPKIPALETITVSAATDTAFNGTWYYAGNMNRATTPDGFESISFTLRRHYAGDCTTQSVP